MKESSRNRRWNDRDKSSCFLGRNVDEKAQENEDETIKSNWKEFASDRAHAAFFLFCIK